MTIRGTIFHNPKFEFHDGEIGNKLLLLLNTPDKNESCLFVKTTSKRKDKPPNVGCFKHNYTGMFFLPKKLHPSPKIHGLYCTDIMKSSYYNFPSETQRKI